MKCRKLSELPCCCECGWQVQFTPGNAPNKSRFVCLIIAKRLGWISTKPKHVIPRDKLNADKNDVNNPFCIDFSPRDSVN